MRSATSSELRPTIGQKCTNKGGRRDAFSNKRRKVPHASRGLLSWPPSLERSERQGLFYDSLVVDWTFEQSENVAIAVMSLSSCC